MTCEIVRSAVVESGPLRGSGDGRVRFPEDLCNECVVGWPRSHEVYEVYPCSDWVLTTNSTTASTTENEWTRRPTERSMRRSLTCCCE